MMRQTAQLAGILALAGFVISTGLGALSLWRGILTGRIGATNTVLVHSTYGKMLIDLNRTDAGGETHWRWATWPQEFALSEPHVGRWWRYGGFGLAIGGTCGGNVVRQFSIPYWAVALLSLVLGIALLMRTASPKAGETPAPR